MAELEDDDNPTSAEQVTEQGRKAVLAVAGANRESTPARGQAATERLALEQEVTALRRAVAGKDRTLDSISLECRRLEDAIEDEHAEAEVLRKQAETLRQELERSATALATERKAATELERDFHELRVRLLSTHRHAGTAPSGGDSTSGFIRYLPPFLIGVGVGVAVAAAAGIGYLGLDGLRGALSRPPVVAEPGIADAPSASAVGVDQAAIREPPGIEQDAAQVQTAEPTVLRTVRDRLGDGSMGPLMVALPTGAFSMGSAGLGGERDEYPEHRVRVGGFLIGANEVTFADYDRFARSTGRRLPGDFGWGRARRPVVDVSWGDAQAYAQWLSRQTGRHYRLPSEAEWEYAARGGAQSAYWWGVGPEVGRAQCFDCGTTWDDGRSTAPVGSFEPNSYGLYDTAGNVLEWTADCYRPSYQGAPTDGTAWDQEPCPARTARGGAFNKPAKSMRSAARAQFAPDARVNMLGFRLARDE
jgi:formylglycine-generating enzyme required for sulfatase activity